MTRNHTSPIEAAEERRGPGASFTIGAVVAALALLGAFLASGDAHAQAAFSQPRPVELGLATPGIESAISVSGQVSLVWRHETGISAAVSNFSDSGSGENATAKYVFDTMQKAAILALGQAAAAGASTGHVDVVATVYRFDAAAGSVNNWAPMGVFINTTDMAIGETGQANFHTRVQFLPDASRQVQPSAGAPALTE